jgi:manganese transport protein
VLIFTGIIFVSLLIYIIIHPWIAKDKKTASIQMHPTASMIRDFEIPRFLKVAVALDFSENDEKLLAYALGQGNDKTRYLLVHIVESASAVILGNESDDYETRKDKEQMESYVLQLQQRGYTTEGFIGYKNRAKEIARIAKELQADMLVMGAHGHTGLKDFIYGETVNTVRHELRIPVLVVNL